jgi:hypothetical protein
MGDLYSQAERGGSAASGSPNRRDTTLAPPAPATKYRPRSRLAAAINHERVRLRPLAALQARLLFAETLTVAGLANEERNHIAETRALCAKHGLPQLLIDARLG